MKKTTLIIAVLAGLLLTVTGAEAASYILYHGQNTANTPTVITLTFTIQGQTWSNNTALNWGTISSSGTYTRTIHITNTGNTRVMLGFSATGLPQDWSEDSGVDGQTLNPGASLDSTLVLTVPTTPDAGSFSWTMAITATPQ